MKLKLTLLALGAGLLMAACNSENPGLAPEGYVYWTDDDGNVMRVAGDGGRIDTLHTGFEDPEVIVFDRATEKLLFVHWADTTSIILADRKPGGNHTVLHDFESSPFMYDIDGGLAIDKNGNFWTSGRFEDNSRAIIKGSTKSSQLDTIFSLPTLFNNQNFYAYSLCTDEEGQKLYLADTRNQIWEMNANGTGTPNVIYNAGTSIGGFRYMKVDKKNNRLLILSQGTGIYSLNLDGTGFTALLDELPTTEVRGIDYDASKNRIYFGAIAGATPIWRMNAAVGSRVDSITAPICDNVYGITVY